MERTQERNPLKILYIPPDRVRLSLCHGSRPQRMSGRNVTESWRGGLLVLERRERSLGFGQKVFNVMAEIPTVPSVY